MEPKFKIIVATDGVGAMAFDEFTIGRQHGGSKAYSLWQAIADPSLLPSIAREFPGIARIMLVRTDLLEDGESLPAVEILRSLLRELPALWGDLVRDGRVTLSLDAESVDAALAVLRLAVREKKSASVVNLG